MMLIGEELWEYLEERGVTRHKHSNGVFSCTHEPSCAEILATGKTKQELIDEWSQVMESIKKDMGLL